MKSKDVIIPKQILDFGRQLNEACDMFDNDYNNFVGKQYCPGKITTCRTMV